MRLFLAIAALIPASLTLLPGCPLGCGAYQGRGDTMFRNQTGDAVMLCAEGGFASTTSKGVVTEGVFVWSDTIQASNPETGARVFSMTSDTSGTYSSPELGAGWTQATLDQVELDHAHVQCTDLTTRAWWGTAGSTSFLPKPTAFKKPAAGFASADACYEAQAAGQYPESALCEDELLACPDGRVKINAGQSFDTGTYDAEYGHLSVRPSFVPPFDGVFAITGTLTAKATYDTTAPVQTWHQVPVTEMSNGATCQ
jgi:hypothetical protein